MPSPKQKLKGRLAILDGTETPVVTDLVQRDGQVYCTGETTGFWHPVFMLKRTRKIDRPVIDRLIKENKEQP